MKGWKRRWFVLEHPGVLYYYQKKAKDSQKKRRYRGSIILHRARIVASPKNKRSFTIETPKNVFFLKCISADQRAVWIKTLTAASQLYDERTEYNIQPREVAASASSEDELTVNMLSKPAAVPKKQAMAPATTPSPPLGAGAAGAGSSSSQQQQQQQHHPHGGQLTSSGSVRALISLGDKIAIAETRASALVSEITQLASEASRVAGAAVVASQAKSVHVSSMKLMEAVHACLEGMGEEVERRLRLEAHVASLTRQVEIMRALVPGVGPPVDDDDDDEEDSASASEEEEEDSAEDDFFDAIEEDEEAEREAERRELRRLKEELLLKKPAVVAPVAAVAGAPASAAVPSGALTSSRWRTLLPAARPSRKDSGTSLWSLLKNSIGKDLSKITLPANLNEPLTVLQRGAEEMESVHLLHRAAACAEGPMRLALVTAWAMSSYHTTVDRPWKPFNPMLGETYEWDRTADLGCRYVAEQVSHHPPISALHLSGPGFVFFGDSQIKSKFWGNSIEVNPTGILHLFLDRPGAGVKDHYTWEKVTTCICSLFGSRYNENYGTMVVTNHTTGETATLEFCKKGGWLSKSGIQHEVEGFVLGPRGEPYGNLFGQWSEVLYLVRGESDEARKRRRKEGWASLPPGVAELWRAPPRPALSKDYYGFTLHGMGLNELPRDLEPLLPPSDARFRQDQRALEEGDVKRATDEKHRLEEKQRAAKRLRDAQGQHWTPRWFSKTIDPDTGLEGWTLDKDYWAVRARTSDARRWEMCPDIW